MSEKLPGCPDSADIVDCVECPVLRELEAERAQLERTVAELEAAVREEWRKAGRHRAPLRTSRR